MTSFWYDALSLSQKKQELLRQLLAPIVTKFEGLLQQMLAETNPDKQAAYAQCLSQAMAFARYVQFAIGSESPSCRAS